MRIFALSFMLIAAIGKTALAQQAVFNVPSQDILSPGQIYGEIDVPFRIEEPRYTAITPRVVIGYGGHFEGGVNVPGYITPGDKLWTAILTLKHCNALDDSGSWTLTEGAHLYLPVTKGPSAGVFGYIMSGKKFSNGIRIAGGIYGATKATTGTKHEIGALGSVEIPLNSWLTIAADGYSGANALGYISSGVFIFPVGNIAIFAAYQFSNISATNNAFLFVLGNTF
ncbi:MAG TPA: hypothetical protein VG537_05420 [Candidatus Kapabacteria bacterium]|jgi:hypothetical protein|nr:hypothetical protein [Candidatus Kapabacteria bacterium]